MKCTFVLFLLFQSLIYFITLQLIIFFVRKQTCVTCNIFSTHQTRQYKARILMKSIKSLAEVFRREIWRFFLCKCILYCTHINAEKHKLEMGIWFFSQYGALLYFLLTLFPSLSDSKTKHFGFLTISKLCYVSVKMCEWSSKFQVYLRIHSFGNEIFAADHK